MTASESHEDRPQRVARVLTTSRTNAGLSRSGLAELAAVDTSTISRLETGRYPHNCSTDTLERLGLALGNPDLLLSAAGRVPSWLVAAVETAEPWALSDHRAALDSVRQLRIRELARPFGTAVSGDATRVDEVALFRAIMRGNPPRPGDCPRERYRFELADTAAHHLLGTSCSAPRVSDEEIDAHELATYLLAPDSLITAAVRAFCDREPSALWRPDLDDLVLHVAETLLVPGWVAALRLPAARLVQLVYLAEEA